MVIFVGIPFLLLNVGIECIGLGNLQLCVGCVFVESPLILLREK